MLKKPQSCKTCKHSCTSVIKGGLQLTACTIWNTERSIEYVLEQECSKYERKLDAKPPQLVRCNKAEICAITDCFHHEPHEKWKRLCGGKCKDWKVQVSCVKVSTTE